MSPTRSTRFDWSVAGLSTLLVAGFYLDLWAHAHGRTDNTFFTPWHAVLYTMLAVVAVFLSVAAYRSWKGGAPWYESLPPGYGLSLLGVALFGLGGVADLVWHAFFGVEFSIDALLSPTHLLLAFSGALIVAGPLRSAWHDRLRFTRPWLARVPAVLSLAFLLSLLTAMTQYIHPLVDTWARTSPVAATTPSELYMMDADGAHQTRLTISHGDSDSDPAVSPDGRSIVFTRSRPRAGRDPLGDIYTMQADGSGATRLTRSSGWYLGPEWSPDGKSIAFSLWRPDVRKWAIGILAASGGDPRLLTDGRAIDIFDGWSPDGGRVVFHSDRDGSDQVYVIATDTTGLKRLTSGTSNWGGSWSPDGQTIAFNSNRTGRLQIFTMSADGRNQRRLVSSNGDDWLPSWSPDGRQIVFKSNRDGGHAQIYVANADGTGQRNLIQTTIVYPTDWSSGWTPGGKVVYAARGNAPAEATPFVRQGLGAASIIVQAAILMGLLLVGLRGNTLPVGSLTLILALNALLLSVIRDQYVLIPGVILAGVLGDLLLWRLRPSMAKPTALRLFSIALPIIIYSCYFLTLQVTGGIGWSIHLWLGTIVVAGIVGLLLSFLVVPPAGMTQTLD